MAARALHAGCPCTAPLGLYFGDHVPPGMFLCEMRFQFKFNGLTWLVTVNVYKACVRTSRGTVWALGASGFARKRYRRLPIKMSFIPTCSDGTQMHAQIEKKHGQIWFASERPASFITYGKNGVTIAPVYAQYVRARQPIQRGKRLLMTQHDRSVLLMVFMCMQRSKPALPVEMREFVISFLNMAHLLYVP